MEFSAKNVISSTLKVGCIYKMTAPERIKTSVPHYFLVVAQYDENNYMFVSTTKYMTKYNYYKDKENLDTITNIQASDTNGLTESSYFDCNQSHEITLSELIKKAEDGLVRPAGNLNGEEFKKYYTRCL